MRLNVGTSSRFGVLLLYVTGVIVMALIVQTPAVDAAGSYGLTFTRYTNCEEKTLGATQAAEINYVDGTLLYDLAVSDWECGKVELDNKVNSAMFAPLSMPGVPNPGVLYGVGGDGPPEYAEWVGYFDYAAFDVDFSSEDRGRINFIQPSLEGVRATPKLGATDCQVDDWKPAIKDFNGFEPLTIWYGCTHMDVTVIPGTDITSIDEITGFGVTTSPIAGGFRVTLPPVTEPEFDLNIGVTMSDDSQSTKQLLVTRLAVKIDTLPPGLRPDEMTEHGGQIDWAGETGPKADRTFITYTGSEIAPVTNPRLIVNYYREENGTKTLLGARQFNPIVGAAFNYDDQQLRPGQTVTDTLIQSSKHANVGYPGANKITIFVISGEVGKDTSSFGGVEYGVGAGWEDILVTHPEHSLYDIWLNGGGFGPGEEE